MRSGAWLCFGLMACLLACSGDYPLAATPCDDYCHATKGLQCDFYNPASCVAQCENDRKNAPACLEQLNAVVTCFRNDPSAVEQRCSFSNFGSGTVFACDLELGRLAECTFLSQSEE